MRARARRPRLAIVGRAGITLIVAGMACARATPSPNASAPNAERGSTLRVSLGVMPSVVIAGEGQWAVRDADGRVDEHGQGQRVSLAASGTTVTLTDGGASARILTPPISVSSAQTVMVNGRRYRGDVVVVLADSGLRVVNRLEIESYLRGVVPRELGTRAATDRAALEAQAVAARSYAVVRLGNTSRPFDVTATTKDQVYGGADAENPVADDAVAATAGLVLTYGGRVVSAPYHSTCGGTTAEPSEVWASRNEPFLQRVSDRIPGSDRSYCDIAPRFRWERSWRADSLVAVIDRYLRNYVDGVSGSIGAVRAVSVDGRTPSGRVAALTLDTERGQYRLRGNDIRYVFRNAGGELLNSTYFSPEMISAPDGRLSRLTIRGFGYGHGIGMCQWGAIGRARAGQDFRTILRTYYPGTTVARAY